MTKSVHTQLCDLFERYLSAHRKMEALQAVPAELGMPIAPFHRKIAWLPKRTFDGRWTWLRRVHRRRVTVQKTRWQYARDDGYAG
jgi:hypothetical protein